MFPKTPIIDIILEVATNGCRRDAGRLPASCQATQQAVYTAPPRKPYAGNSAAMPWGTGAWASPSES